VAPNCFAQRNFPRSFDRHAACPNLPSGCRRSWSTHAIQSPAKNRRETFQSFHANRHQNARRDSPLRCVATIRRQNGNSRRGTCRLHQSSFREIHCLCETSRRRATCRPRTVRRHVTSCRGSRRLHETSRRATCRRRSVRRRANAHRRPNVRPHASPCSHAKKPHGHHRQRRSQASRRSPFASPV